MKNPFVRNCCDGVYNSFDVHFTSVCDNKCAHCIDNKYDGLNIKKPDAEAIAKTIIDNQEGYEDVLFLGGEPCLYLKELRHCIRLIQENTNLKVYVTTAVPKTCYDNYTLFKEILDAVDGMNLSVQHHDEKIADEIRQTKSLYDRQAFYNGLPHKNKIRINVNIVKPFLYTQKDINSFMHAFDWQGFNEIKISEIQHGKEYFVSFEDIYDKDMGSPYFNGCQTHIDTCKTVGLISTPVLLKRSCFICEETLKASFLDGVKVLYKAIMPRRKNKYAVVYEDGTLTRGWR